MGTVESRSRIDARIDSNSSAIPAEICLLPHAPRDEKCVPARLRVGTVVYVFKLTKF